MQPSALIVPSLAWSVQGSMDVSEIDPLMEADADEDILILEGHLRLLWACMSTMHSMMLELMSEVELINLELKKKRKSW
jgi:hypothetical protein